MYMQAANILLLKRCALYLSLNRIYLIMIYLQHMNTEENAWKNLILNG